MIVRVQGRDGVFWRGELMREPIHHDGLPRGATVVFVPQNVISAEPDAASVSPEL